MSEKRERSRRKRQRRAARKRGELMPLRDAVAAADAADLPDGAWMAYICELTGLDAGQVTDQLRGLT
jgi:hypothetical protein